MLNAEVMLPSTDATYEACSPQAAPASYLAWTSRGFASSRAVASAVARLMACLNSAAMAASGFGSVTFDLLMLPR